METPSPSSIRARFATAPLPEDAHWGPLFEARFRWYVVDRGFSEHQRRILKLYLQGANDKEIALICECSEATVYEHWRRMARKLGLLHKCAVIADFHRYLTFD